ncbi:hypothetical protein, partial [Prevotella sp. OH937_COT-195]
MIFFRKKKLDERQLFFDLIHEAYNSLDISNDLKKHLLQAAIAIENNENLNLISYKLHPYVCNEFYVVPELKELKVYVERKRAKCFIGL